MEHGTATVASQDHNLTDGGSTPHRATKRYERIGQLTIRPLLLQKEHSAFDLARVFYAQCNLDFVTDFVDYLRNGFVISRPHLFVMLKPIEHEGERIWYIRMVIGNLMEAILCLPCMLPKVAFCRNNQADKMVVCDTERAIRVAMMTMKGNKNGRWNNTNNG